MSSYIETRHCTVVNRKGVFCDAIAGPDMPFAICIHHALQLYRRVKEIVEAASAPDTPTATKVDETPRPVQT